MNNLDCGLNKSLKTLNAGGCSNLTTINCNYCSLTNLNVDGCSNLLWLTCIYNSLTNLDVSSCVNLTNYLDCGHNSITNLNLRGCSKLQSLLCNDNKLARLDVSSCNALVIINCQNNAIQSEIPDWFRQLKEFRHDARYNYYILDGKILYTDNSFGWWYPGEPEKGYHRW